MRQAAGSGGGGTRPEVPPMRQAARSGVGAAGGAARGPPAKQAVVGVHSARTMPRVRCGEEVRRAEPPPRERWPRRPGETYGVGSSGSSAHAEVEEGELWWERSREGGRGGVWGAPKSSRRGWRFWESSSGAADGGGEGGVGGGIAGARGAGRGRWRPGCGAESKSERRLSARSLSSVPAGCGGGGGGGDGAAGGGSGQGRCRPGCGAESKLERRLPMRSVSGASAGLGGGGGGGGGGCRGGGSGGLGRGSGGCCGGGHCC
jgi:hypothetical protein